MSVLVNRVRPGLYLDSVALMRLSRDLAGLPGVADAALMVGTPANRDILAQAGLLDSDGEQAGPGDLIVALRAADAVAADSAMADALRRIDRPAAAMQAGPARRPRSLSGGVKSLPDANLALISVPGTLAAAEARKALRLGLHTMIFSDNVPLADELALKRMAGKAGLLVMGPDCGTAIVAGLPLAFANIVPRGEIGIIGASGTGIQEVSCLIARRGGGVSHALGVGGRDLSDAVGGLSCLAAIDALDGDAATRAIVLVSKPPSPAVTARIAGRIAASPKPFVLCLLGAGQTAVPANARLVPDLRSAAEMALALAGIPACQGAEPVPAPVKAGGRRLTGLFCGGTLCAEAQLVLSGGGAAVASNVPVPGAVPLTDPGPAHRLIDLGADEYTRGRPHPMLEPEIRNDLLRDLMAEPETGVILLDLIIGQGAHHDPAGALAGLAAGRPGGRPVMVASVTGTDSDPQNRARQVAALRAAGILVAPSNAEAAALALACLETPR